MYKIKPQDSEWIEMPSATDITKLITSPDGLMAWSAISAVKQACVNVFEAIKGNYNLLTLVRAIKKATFAYKDISKEALDVGSEVHNLIELHIKGKIKGKDFAPRGGLKPQVKSGFSAFLKWEKENVEEWIESEQPVYHPVLMVGGTLDAVGRLTNNRGVYVIDFKSSKGFYDGYDLQLAIYRYGREHFTKETYFDVKRRDGDSYRVNIKPIKTDGMGVLRLDKKTGKPEWKDYSKVYDRCIEAVKGLLIFFYAYKKRRLNNKRAKGGD